MDFKVAGTSAGVTALQMDIKIEGINEQIMEVALEQALQARLHILGQMNAVLESAREITSENAPSMVTLKVDSTRSATSLVRAAQPFVRSLRTQVRQLISMTTAQ